MRASISLYTGLDIEVKCKIHILLKLKYFNFLLSNFNRFFNSNF